MSKGKDYVWGLKQGIPVLFGFVPVGIAYGIMAREAGMSALQTIIMSMTVFAGASEIMATGMIAEGASIIAIIIATFLLNLRHLIMSTCVFEKMKPGKNPLKYIAAFGVTDESFGIYTNKREAMPLFTFLGMITVTWSSWQAGSAIGALVGDLLPGIISSSFEVALYAMFIAMVMPSCKKSFRIALLVLITAGCNIGLNYLLPSHWALIISTLVCAGMGLFFVDPDDTSGWFCKKKKEEKLVSDDPSGEMKEAEE